MDCRQECIVKLLQSLSLGYAVSLLSSKEEEEAAEKGNDDDKEQKVEKELVSLYLAALAIVFSSLSFVLLTHPYFFAMQRTAMQVRVACSSLLYKKALSLTLTQTRQTTVGQLVNMLSNDMSRFDHSLIFIPFLLVGPMQLIITVAILWPRLGVACLAGVCMLLIYMLLQTFLGRLFSKLRQRTAVLSDRRIRLTNEIITQMSAVKLHVLEMFFMSLLERARQLEVDKIRQTAYLRALNMALFFVSSKLTLFLVFMAYISLGNSLSASTLFLSVSLMNALRSTMTMYFPYAVAGLAESLISVSRLEASTVCNVLMTKIDN